MSKVEIAVYSFFIGGIFVGTLMTCVAFYIENKNKKQQI